MLRPGPPEPRGLMTPARHEHRRRLAVLLAVTALTGCHGSVGRPPALDARPVEGRPPPPVHPPPPPRRPPAPAAGPARPRRRGPRRARRRPAAGRRAARRHGTAQHRAG